MVLNPIEAATDKYPVARCATTSAAMEEHMPAQQRAVLMCALALLAGCAASRPDLQYLTPDLQRLTAGKIGCPPEGVTIGDAQGSSAMMSWTATCQGKHYFCAAEDMFRAVSCVLKFEEKE